MGGRRGSWQQAGAAGGRELGPCYQHRGLGQSPGLHSFIAGQLGRCVSLGAGLRVMWGLGWMCPPCPLRPCRLRESMQEMELGFSSPDLQPPLIHFLSLPPALPLSAWGWEGAADAYSGPGVNSLRKQPGEGWAMGPGTGSLPCPPPSPDPSVPSGWQRPWQLHHKYDNLIIFSAKHREIQ